MRSRGQFRRGVDAREGTDSWKHGHGCSAGLCWCFWRNPACEQYRNASNFHFVGAHYFVLLSKYLLLITVKYKKKKAEISRYRGWAPWKGEGHSGLLWRLAVGEGSSKASWSTFETMSEHRKDPARVGVSGSAPWSLSDLFMFPARRCLHSG